MQGGVRKRGTTWSYYFDLGKIDGKSMHDVWENIKEYMA